MNMLKTSNFIEKHQDFSMMQYAINDQENGSLVHGKFIATMH
jgi:hypothetical protein